jgi:hypothetical protein
MPRLFLTLLPLYTLLFLLIIAAIFTGHQQSPSAWAQLFHLDDCELPCWIGIVPGQTTLIEGQQQVERLYDNSSMYSLEEQDYQFKATYTASEIGLGIVFVTNDLKQPESIIEQIYLLPYIGYSSANTLPTIPDLYNGLGKPITVRLAGGTEIVRIAMFYKDLHARVITTYQLECGKVRLTQEIGMIWIVSKVQSPGEYWLSDPHTWRGFGRCYHFEQKLSQ